jgi:hypothetical protein
MVRVTVWLQLLLVVLILRQSAAGSDQCSKLQEGISRLYEHIESIRDLKNEIQLGAGNCHVSSYIKICSFWKLLVLLSNMHAIYSLPGYHISFDALHNPPGIGMRAVHSAGRAATTHEFLLLLPILLILQCSCVCKLAVSGFKIPATGFKLPATGFNPFRDVGLGRKKGARYGLTPYLLVPYAIKWLRTYNLQFITN